MDQPQRPADPETVATEVPPPTLAGFAVALSAQAKLIQGQTKTIDTLKERLAIAENMIEKLKEIVDDSRAALAQQEEATGELLESLELDEGEVLVKGIGSGGNAVSYQVVTTGVGEAAASVAVALAAEAAAERNLDDVMDME